MNKLTGRLIRTMQPTAALVVYTCEGGYYDDKYYLEIRGVNSAGLMEAGKPVSLKFMQSLVENFSDKTSSAPHGEIPQGMLYADVRNEKYVWRRPPCRKYLYFKSELNIPNGYYCLPGLVWMARGNSLFLFAYRAKRLSHDTQLYAAPCFNVNPKDGSVCMGNAKVITPVKNDFKTYIQCREERFFLSEFSHVLGNNPTRSNLVLVVKNSTEKFDDSELLPIKNLKLKKIFV